MLILRNTARFNMLLIGSATVPEVGLTVAKMLFSLIYPLRWQLGQWSVFMIWII